VRTVGERQPLGAPADEALPGLGSDCAKASHCASGSMPVTRRPASRANLRLNQPVPQPTSSRLSPGRGRSRSTSCRNSTSPIHAPRGVRHQES
jgi:hypothetical protein